MNKPTKEEQDRAGKHADRWLSGLAANAKINLSDHDRRNLKKEIALALCRARLKILWDQKIMEDDE